MLRVISFNHNVQIQSFSKQKDITFLERDLANLRIKEEWI